MIFLEKIKFYFNEYVSAVRWIKAIIMPVIIALIISNYLEIQCSFISAKFTTEDQNLSRDHYLLKLYTLYFVISYSLKYVVNIFNSHFIGTSLRTAYKNFFYEFLTIKYKDFQDIGIGEAQYTITRRASALSDFLTTITMSMISNLFFFLLVIHTVNSQIPAYIKIRLFAAILSFLILSMFIQFLRTKLRRKVNDGLQRNSRKLYDALLNYERIVTFDNIDVECKKYSESMHDQVYYGVFYWISYEAVGMLNSMFFIVLNLYLIYKFNTLDSLTTDKLKEFIMVITKLREKVFDLSKDIDDIYTSFTNLDQSLIENCKKEENLVSIHINQYEKGIEAKDLTLNYGSKVVFSNVDCEIPKGSKIAITGENGGGKSTFVKTLLGLYDYEGSLRFDGYEYNLISKKSLRELISYVPQHSCLFDTTLMENLTIGNKNIGDDKVVEYCKMYNMHRLFHEIGYNKSVGERGKNLSGGQRQKISFMRAVLRNTPILIFDEATSNMDLMSEKEIISMIQDNMQSKTVLMIIHNLNLLRDFDRVLFFAENKLLGDDSFDKLYEENDRFRKYFDDAIEAAI